MATPKEIRSPADADAVMSEPLVVLLKYGSHCQISAAARRELEAFVQRRPDAPIALLAVDVCREASDHVADRLGVPHESPQAFLLRDGEVVWHAAHYSIVTDELDRKFAAAGAGAPRR